MKKKITQKQLLLDNAEDVIEMIEEGKTYDYICKKMKVNRRFLNDFISDSNFSARARDAQRRSASKYAELALESLNKIKTGDDKADITRQRELAHHYRWLAKVKSPKEFNENRIEADVNDIVKAIIDVPARMSREEWLKNQNNAK